MAFKNTIKPKTNPYLFAVIVLLFIFLMIIIPFHHHKKCSTNNNNYASYTPFNQQSAVFSNNDDNVGNGDPLQSGNAFYKAPSNNAYGYGLPPPFPINTTAVVVPVNVPTQRGSGGFSQIGILEGGNNGEILPLMGRISQRNHSRFQYYTMQNGVGNINNRLNILVNGKVCSGENGCNEFNNGDNVKVQGYNGNFNVSLYENKTLEYIPII